MRPDVQMIEEFLRKVDDSFPVPLHEKQDLGAFARKLHEKATLCWVEEDGQILSMAAGYTNGLVDGMGYISILATLEQARGKGYGQRLIRQFLDICAEKGIAAVHLYAVESNTAAMRLYRGLGFEPWRCDHEQRPGDVHLIKYLCRG